MKEENRQVPGVTSPVPGGLWHQEPPYVNEGGLSLLDAIIVESRDEEQREQSRLQIATLMEGVMLGTIPIDRDLGRPIAARIAAIDMLLSRQLNEILHASDFQRLEGTWRGLYQLVHQSKTSTLLKIRVLNVSKQELHRDLQDVPLQKSVFFKKVYEEEYGSFGGTLYRGAHWGLRVRTLSGGHGTASEDLSRGRRWPMLPSLPLPVLNSFALKSFTELSGSRN